MRQSENIIIYLLEMGNSAVYICTNIKSLQYYFNTEKLKDPKLSSYSRHIEKDTNLIAKTFFLIRISSVFEILISSQPR